MIFFFCFNILCCCFFLITCSNLVYSLVFLILVFINMCFIFSLLSLSYFSCIFLIISIGAVGVFFLFVIMNLAIRSSLFSFFDFYFYIFFIFFFFMSFFFFYFFSSFSFFSFFTDYLFVEHTNWNNLVFCSFSSSFYDFLKISILIYTDLYLYLFVGCFILLIAMVGSILITNYKSNWVGLQLPSQVYFIQNRSKFIILKKK